MVWLEGIDWLVALKGDDAEKNLAALGAALHKFLADKPVGKMVLPALEKAKIFSKDLMTHKALKDQWPANVMLERFITPMDKDPGAFAKIIGIVDESDYKNIVQARGMKPEHIAKDLGKVVDGCEKFLENIKNADKYESTYSSEATWAGSCVEDPEACAIVLVGMAPMLYVGLRALRMASLSETQSWLHPGALEHLGNVLNALGYRGSGCRANMSGSYLYKLLQYNVNFKVLETIYRLAGFWAFY
ncbi:hypothetical protein BBBOND_0209980 [Babesia bigemina]|uniref:Uncharacterized protein n=1 Tax=Babesia bigemina TaxID=5866 RepID=A0A061DD01_BABBI|nr:hypothetical protein BBBOND_0209980 [Babesia bigemina]CDR95845.1 hypothetical protein BBBOND_0209980 [Babesia bigemina]|eukprot:XP_012768031.1 hypothetical protein BBBOND_0209980 [Babesia bigemina]